MHATLPADALTNLLTPIGTVAGQRSYGIGAAREAPFALDTIEPGFPQTNAAVAARRKEGAAKINGLGFDPAVYMANGQAAKELSSAGATFSRRRRRGRFPRALPEAPPAVECAPLTARARPACSEPPQGAIKTSSVEARSSASIRNSSLLASLLDDEALVTPTRPPPPMLLSV